LIISAENVSFQYKGATDLSLRKITIELTENKIYLLCGPTGSGKTTFIRALNGLIPHFYPGLYYGYLKVNGLDTVDSNTSKLSEHVGMVFQNPENQLFAMNVERELAFGLENLGYPQEEIRRRINKAITLLKLESIRYRPPYQLSGGEQQKVAIASLVSMEPDVLVFDEPLSNLDPQSAEEIMHILVQLQKEHHKTLIIVEHRIEYVLPFTDNVILFKDGQIIEQGPLTDVVEHEPFFRLGLDLPPLLLWFKKQRELGIYQGALPLSHDAKQKALIAILQKKEQTECEDHQIKKPSHQVIIESMPQIPHIIFDQVTFRYKQGIQSNVALNNISTTLYSGEIVGIIGPNGAGKSTFVRCINGLRRPEQGIIWVQGKSIKKIPEYQLAQQVGVIFQNPEHQLFASTLEEELQFSLKNLHLSSEEFQKRIDQTLIQLKLSEFKDRSPFQISGGQKKKASIATILCRHTPILIFDEPTIGQDAEEKRNLAELMIAEQKHGHTILVISHDLDFISQIATRILILKEGQIYADGSPEKILSDKNLLSRCSLKQLELNVLIQGLCEQFPWVPSTVISTDQLEELHPRR
jgi:energy-coupling factor transport system ATP-binding protein